MLFKVYRAGVKRDLGKVHPAGRALTSDWFIHPAGSALTSDWFIHPAGSPLTSDSSVKSIIAM